MPAGQREQLAAVVDGIIAAVDEGWAVTFRGVCYRTVSAGAVPTTDAGYRLVGRQLLKLGRDGAVSYDSFANGARWVS